MASRVLPNNVNYVTEQFNEEQTYQCTPCADVFWNGAFISALWITYSIDKECHNNE